MKTKIIIFLTALFALMSCKTIAQYSSTKKYAVSDSSRAPETILTLKQQNKNLQYAELTSQLLGWSSLRGQLKKEQNDDLTFEINELHLFGNWPNGWTDAVYEAYGKIVFKKNGNTYQAKIENDLELFEIKSGGIRYIDNFYIDKDGAEKVAQRINRSEKLVSFLKERNFDKFYGSPSRETKYGKSFRNATQAYLFPETKGFGSLEKKNLLPEIYYKNTAANQDATGDKTVKKSKSKYQFAQGYIWNKDYTARVFPADLQDLRNTGSLWRDYEEAVQIIFTLYNLDYYYKEILNNSEFTISR